MERAVNKIVQKIFKTSPSTIEEIRDKGRRNIVVKLQVENNLYILRLHTHKQELETYKKERWGSDIARKLGILTPKILEIGTEEEYVFSLQDFVDGKQGTEVPDESKKIWQTLGQYAKIFNSAPAPSLKVDYKEIVQSLFADNSLTSNEVLSKELSVQIQNRLEETLKWGFSPTLSHGNLHPSNVVLHPDGEIYIIDWGEISGNWTPRSELGEIYTWKNGKENISFFLEGYGLGEKELKVMMRDIQTLVLLRLVGVLKKKTEKNKDWTQDEYVRDVSFKLNSIDSYQEDVLFTKNL